ncbi:MAG: N-acetyl-gamma-glutamyl-phosphate reductase [Xanthomonadaceae bacterium]|nr:N-acetyl-gamma-glutamyl-phosphate reductase [Xanthomonadaceae bacterium]
MAKHRIGIVGARGYVGAEFIRLLAGHPDLDLAFVGSRELDGRAVSEVVPEYQGAARYEALDVEGVARRGAAAVVLALPNGMAEAYARTITALAPDTVIVDVSADYRFDDGWFYGLPELNRAQYRGQRRISNPGCYATAMQLAIAPMVELLARPAQCFGVSGYSGAGTTPSDKNDVDNLRDNLMPYSLVGHLHEREVTRHLGHPVEFMPHVAPHFRGITMTVNLHLKMKMWDGEVRERYHARYDGEPLIRIGDAPPWVSRIAGHHGVEIGGFALSADNRRLVVVATLDNLLKGAATQALQNLNLALGLPELSGIPLDAAFAPAT